MVKKRGRGWNVGVDVMDRFLRKHDVDVGKAFGVLYLAGAVEQAYVWVTELIFAGAFSFDFVGVIIALYLGVGMYRHSDSARGWSLFLMWAAMVVFTILVAVSLSAGEGNVLSIGGREIVDPPFWKLVAAWVLVVPLFWASVAALTCRKAREEFGCDAQCVDDLEVLVAGVTEPEAAFIVGALKERGVEAAAEEGSVPALGMLLPGGIRVVVREGDLDRAKEALADYREGVSDIDWTNVDVGGRDR